MGVPIKFERELVEAEAKYAPKDGDHQGKPGEGLPEKQDKAPEMADVIQFPEKVVGKEPEVKQPEDKVADEEPKESGEIRLLREKLGKAEQELSRYAKRDKEAGGVMKRQGKDIADLQKQLKVLADADDIKKREHQLAEINTRRKSLAGSFGDEGESVVSDLEDIILSKARAELDNDIKPLKEKLAYFEEMELKNKELDFYGNIGKEVENFRIINAMPSFHQYILTETDLLGNTLDDVIQIAEANKNPAPVIKIMRAFLEKEGLAENKKEKLESLVTPPKGKASPETQKQETITKQQAMEFYDKWDRALRSGHLTRGEKAEWDKKGAYIESLAKKGAIV